MNIYALTALFAAIPLFPPGADMSAIASWATLFSGIALVANRLLQPNVEPIWASVVSAKVRTIILVVIAGVGPAAAALATASTWQEGVLNALWAAFLGVAGALGLNHVVPASGTPATQAKFELSQLNKKP